MNRPDLNKIRELVHTVMENTSPPEGESCLVFGKKYYVLRKNMSSQEFYKITEELTNTHYEKEEEFLEKTPQILLDLCAYIEELEKKSNIRVIASALNVFAPDLAEELVRRWKEYEEKNEKTRH